MDFEKDGTKRDIFYAAIELFSEKSYFEVSMRDIARKVGIKASSLYNHYESKEDILDTLFEYASNYLSSNLPDLDYLLKAVENEHPYVVLKLTNAPPIVNEDEYIIGKILLIASIQMPSVQKAWQIIYDNLIIKPKLYLQPILEKMIRLEKIEPIDIESFIHIHTTCHYSAAMKLFSDFSIAPEKWDKALDYLFSFITVKV